MFKKIKILVFLVFCFSMAESFSQDLEKDANANFKDFYFHLALKQYLELYDKDSTNLEYNYRIGFCYLNLELNRSLALPFLQKAYDGNYDESNILLDLGLAYFYNHKFDKAIEFFQQFKQHERNKDLIQYAGDYISYASNAKKLFKRPLNVTFHNLGEEVNSEESDYNPYFNETEKKLYFTTSRKYNSIYKVYINNVYYTEFDGRDWDRSRSAGSRVNSNEDEILAGIANNDAFLFVHLRQFDIFNDTYIAEIDRGRIRDMYNPGENINSKEMESGATLSITGDTLIFASNRSGGYGGLDLYLSMRLPDGSWGEPQNIGDEINTKYDEDFPHFEENSKTLYFASKGHNSMGGYDLFRSSFNSRQKKWGTPNNLGYPVNTVYDDQTISFTKDQRYAYKADIKDTGFGSTDIYQIVFNDHEKVYSVFKGKVMVADKDSLTPITAYHQNLYLIVNETGSDKMIGKYKINNKTSEYVVALPPGKYDVLLEIDQYQAKRQIFIIPEMNSNEIIIRRNVEFQPKDDR